MTDQAGQAGPTTDQIREMIRKSRAFPKASVAEKLALAAALEYACNELDRRLSSPAAPLSDEQVERILTSLFSDWGFTRNGTLTATADGPAQTWPEIIRALAASLRGDGVREAAQWVDQGPGECWTACLASLTGIPLADFPKPPHDAVDALRWADREQETAYHNAVVNFLLPRGWMILPTWARVPAGYAIAFGPSARSAHVGHCVVTLNGEMVHDPHPEKSGLAGPAEQYEILVPLKALASPVPPKEET